MKRLISIVIVLTVAAALLVLFPMRQADAGLPITWVDSTVNSAYWPVKAAKDSVDQYTTSMMPFGTCRTGYRCIRVRELTINSSWAGYTQCYSWGCNVYLNPQRRGYSWGTKRRIVAHELAHTVGVWWHTYTCDNIMYYRVYCSNGSLPSYRFLANQIVVMRRY